MIRCSITFRTERAIGAFHEAADDCYCNARDDNQQDRCETIAALMGWIADDNEARLAGVCPITLDNMPAAYLSEAVKVLQYCRDNEILDQGEVKLTAR